jgi:hypothetical protein
MKWKEKETAKGQLKYRLPNVAEGYDFLSAIEKIENAQDAFKIKGKFISKLENLVDHKSLGYASFEELLEDDENNFVVLGQIADEIFIAITKALGKKNLSAMPSTQAKAD